MFSTDLRKGVSEIKGIISASSFISGNRSYRHVIIAGSNPSSTFFKREED